MVPTFPWRAHTPTNRDAMGLPSYESSDRAARRGSAAAPTEPRARTLNSRPPSQNGSRRQDRRICGDRGSLSCAPTLWKRVQEGVSGCDNGPSRPIDWSEDRAAKLGSEETSSKAAVSEGLTSAASVSEEFTSGGFTLSGRGAVSTVLMQPASALIKIQDRHFIVVPTPRSTARLNRSLRAHRSRPSGWPQFLEHPEGLLP